MNFNTFLEEISSKYGKKSAISCDGTNITYSKLLSEINKFASGLFERGVKKGEKVSILLGNRIEFVIAFFGIIRTGAIAVPINPTLLPEEVEYILRHSSSNYFITASDFEEHMNYVEQKIDEVQLIISADYKDPFGRIMRFKSVYSEKNFHVPKLSENDPCALLYSSGTQGTLKGVLLSHNNFLSNALSCRDFLNINQDDKLVSFLPLYHSFSLTLGLIMILSAGGTIILIKNVYPFSKVIKTVIVKRATLFLGIPYVFKLLSTVKPPKLFKMMNSLRFCISGGSHLHIDVLKKFEEMYNVTILEGYGLLEAGPVVSLNPPNLEARKAGSVGKIISGVEVSIFDNSKKKCKVNELGEIAVKSPGVMKEYYRDKSSTKQAMHKGWLLTGDLGKLDKDGYLYVLDRKSDVIYSDGQVIFPKDIEEIIHTHEDIEEVAVVGINDSEYGNIPLAVVRLKDKAKINADGLKSYIYGKGFTKVPVKVEIWEEIPRSSIGKILKREIKRMIK